MRYVCRLLGIMATLYGCGQGGDGTDTAASGSTSGGSTGGSSTSGEAPTTSGPAADSTSGATGEAASTGESSGGSTGDDPFDDEPVCSSNKYWTMGNHESPYMHPGMACQTCHTMMEPILATRFPIAGTVYPTGHEPDDCLGFDGVAMPTFVEVTTADMRVIQLPVNSSGNFHYDVVSDGGQIQFPITARVVRGDQVREMLAPQATGDCNSCHTQAGTQSAPGRIVAP